MSCEQMDFNKRWKERIVNLVNQKNSFLENPELFLEKVWEASLVLKEIPPRSYLESVWLDATLRLTGVMRPEELTVLKDGLERVWKEKADKKLWDDIDVFRFKAVVNSLMVCQDARKVSCVKMVPDL